MLVKVKSQASGSRFPSPAVEVSHHSFHAITVEKRLCPFQRVTRLVDSIHERTEKGREGGAVDSQPLSQARTESLPSATTLPGTKKMLVNEAVKDPELLGAEFLCDRIPPSRSLPRSVPGGRLLELTPPRGTEENPRGPHYMHRLEPHFSKCSPHKQHRPPMRAYSKCRISGPAPDSDTAF